MNERLAPALKQAKESRAKRIRESRATGHVIYFFQAGKHIKVGISRRGAIKSRINSIQCGNPHHVKVLKILHTISPRQDERLFHKLLHQYHVRGEWFLITNAAILELLGAS